VGRFIPQDYNLTQEDRDFGDTRNTSVYASGPLIDGLLGLQCVAAFNREESTDIRQRHRSQQRGPPRSRAHAT